MEIIGFSFAVLIGVSLGMIGGGGSILTVPVLVYLFNYPAKEAIAMSLGVVGIAALFGAGNHYRQGNVLPQTAFLVGIFSMGGAYVGSSFVAPLLSGTFQLILFAITMLAAAFFMFRGRGDSEPQKKSALLMAVLGFLVGVFTGLVGVGGGFLLVPTLVLLAGVPMKKAVGTSLLIISLNSVAGVLGYSSNVEIPWGFVGLFSVLTVVGIFIGSYWVKHVSQGALKKVFAVFLIFMGLFILYKNRAQFISTASTEPAGSKRVAEFA